jgi:hypothetical protein
MLAEEGKVGQPERDILIRSHHYGFVEDFSSTFGAVLHSTELIASSFSIENRSLCLLCRPACLRVPLLRLFPCHWRTASITKILSSMVKSNVLVIRRLFVESSTPPNSSSNTLFATNGRLAFTSLNEHLLTKIGKLTSVRQAFNPSQTITCEARNQRAAL